MMYSIRRASICVLFFYAGVRADPFATEVMEYSPAPGQFVNVAAFSDPSRALGPPFGGGTAQPNNANVVSLGGFGGSITLKFDHLVQDHPLNPFGLDAIVFGNAHWVGGDPQRHWAECATIEISLDANANGMADDPWYLIAGSHSGPSVVPYSVTWDDDVEDSKHGPDDEAWIPQGESGEWDTDGYLLPVAFQAIPLRNPLSNSNVEGIWGYAEFTPTLVLGDWDADNFADDPQIVPERFYVRPDDPLAVGITAKSGGGDAFDVTWAIDAETGENPQLAGFHFIRVTTAVNYVLQPFGEISAEIDAVSDAAIDPFGDFDADGDIDLVDLAAAQNCGPLAACCEICHQFEELPTGIIAEAEYVRVVNRMTGPVD